MIRPWWLTVMRMLRKFHHTTEMDCNDYYAIQSEKCYCTPKSCILYIYNCRFFSSLTQEFCGPIMCSLRWITFAIVVYCWYFIIIHCHSFINCFNCIYLSPIVWIVNCKDLKSLTQYWEYCRQEHSKSTGFLFEI